MYSKAHSYLLTLGHACADIGQGALPALLPFLVLHYSLSYAAAAAIVTACSVVSAVIQPLFGYLGDKVDRPWFMSLGILLSGTGIAAMGFVDSYWFILCCAIVTGTGASMFHPEGGKLANVVAGKSKGTGISNFAVGGNLGFAIGPAIATFALAAWGLRGTIVFFIPAITAAIILQSQSKAFRRMTQQEIERIAKSNPATHKDDWVGFTKLTFANVMRVTVGSGMTVFITLYWIAVLHQPAQYAALMLTVYSASGAVATFFGGRIADRVGFKRIAAFSIGSIGPLLVIFLLMDQVVPAAILLVVFALMHNLAFAPMVAMGQAYLPNRLGFASGISMGVVVSVGGLAATGLGAIGDIWGLPTSMLTICLIACVGLGVFSLLFMGRNANDGIGEPTKTVKKSSADS